MTLGVPIALLSQPRAAATAEGSLSAQELVASVFPPRPEDPTGSLAIATIEAATNMTVRAQLRARADDRQARQWWLEGLVIGYCVAACEALRHVQTIWDVDPIEQLTEMEARVDGKTADTGLRDASALVFELCRTVYTEDEMGTLWAVEHLWRPNGLRANEVEQFAARVRHVLSSALMTTCASWTLLLGALGDPA